MQFDDRNSADVRAKTVARRRVSFSDGLQFQLVNCPVARTDLFTRVPEEHRQARDPTIVAGSLSESIVPHACRQFANRPVAAACCDGITSWPGFEINEFRLPKSSGADTASPSALVSNMPQMRQPAPQIGHFARLAGME